MKTYDFIKSNVGESVKVINKGDLVFDVEMRRLIYDKPELMLVKLSKSGMAVIAEGKKTHIIPPTCIRLANDESRNY